MSKDDIRTVAQAMALAMAYPLVGSFADAQSRNQARGWPDGRGGVIQLADNELQTAWLLAQQWPPNPYRSTAPA
jgi:hypothetical protein